MLPLLPFQCLRPTAKLFLRRLRCQEDGSFKIFWPPFGGDHRGTPGGGPPPPPFRPPLLTHPCGWGLVRTWSYCSRGAQRGSSGVTPKKAGPMWPLRRRDWDPLHIRGSCVEIAGGPGRHRTPGSTKRHTN